MITFVAALVSAAAIAALWLMLQRAWAQVDELRHSNDILRNHNDSLHALVQTMDAETRRHLEMIHACEDPAAVHALTERLLRDPWGLAPNPTTPDTPPTPGVD